jgi:tetratricopeptide (TPR) repeat protein
VAREAAGDVDGAITDYSAAIRLAPARARGALYGRGNALRTKGDWDAAIADYTAALGLDPTAPEVLVNRALARRMRGDLAGAAADYVEALRVAPPGWPWRATLEHDLDVVRAQLSARVPPALHRLTPAP